MFQLLGSFFKRLTTIVTTPFRLAIVKIQRLFNVNIISAKLISPLRKTIKKLITLKPESRTDYVVVGKWWVYKKLFLTIILVICAGVFIYFNMFASKLPAAMPTAAAVKTDVTFDYNDMALRDFTGVANIRASDGSVVYTGDVAAGVCTGTGILWSREGKLLYEGQFAQNRYSGQGTSYYPSGKKRYEGNWENNLYNGAGKLYADNGALIYDGGMKDGLYDGEGKAYSDTGVLLYEGSYAAGLYHGVGTSYYNDGTTHYIGEFLSGMAQGKGQLYDYSGKLLYTGYMHEGQMNYRALVNGSYADILNAFEEHPRVFYTDNECAFAFEQAGVIVTVDCRVQVDVWEKNAAAEDQRDYYMPGDAWGQPAQGAYQEGGDSWYRDEGAAPREVYPDELYPEESNWEEESYWEEESQNGEQVVEVVARPLGGLSIQHAVVGSSKPEIRPVDWYMVDETSPDESESAGDSSQSRGEGESSGLEIHPDSEQSFGGAAGTRPDFIQKDLTLYFEIDKNVWRSEPELDASKIAVKKITVFSGNLSPVAEDAVEFSENAQPFIEDCVAIDFIRQRQPTAFPQVMFEADRQNKLFVPIVNINFANQIYRKTYLMNDVTYRYAYNQAEDTAPLYFSVER